MAWLVTNRASCYLILLKLRRKCINREDTMHEPTQSRKNKICLEDYDFKHDIDNRLAMAEFSIVDLELLEEILYSSIKVSIRKLAKSLDLEDEEIQPSI